MGLFKIKHYLPSFPDKLQKEGCVEDALMSVGLHLGLKVNSIHLFGLRKSKSLLWMAPREEGNECDVEFRVRFRPANLERVMKFDGALRNYLYYQVLGDYLKDELPLRTDDLLFLGMISTLHERKINGKAEQYRDVAKKLPPLVAQNSLRALNLYTQLDSFKSVEKLEQSDIQMLFLKLADYHCQEKTRTSEDYLGMLGGEKVKSLAGGPLGTKMKIRLMVQPFHPNTPGICFGRSRVASEEDETLKKLDKEIQEKHRKLEECGKQIAGSTGPAKKLLEMNLEDLTEEIAKKEDEVKEIQSTQRAEGKFEPWEVICKVEELVTIYCDSKKFVAYFTSSSKSFNLPFWFKFNGKEEMLSFVSCINGYYRLMKSWTVDLCETMSSPLLAHLEELACHGPVGREFSYCKLDSSGRRGAWLLRLCNQELCYHIDVYDGVKMKSEQISKAMVDKENAESKKCYFLNAVKNMCRGTASFIAPGEAYAEIGQLSIVPLQLLPSDRDQPPYLLLGASDELQPESRPDVKILTCGSFEEKDKGKDEHEDNEDKDKDKNKDEDEENSFSNFDLGSFYNVIKTKLDVAGEKKDVVIKCPRSDQSMELQDCCGAWMLDVNDCKSLVKVHGIIISPFSLVMEFVNYGPVNKLNELDFASWGGKKVVGHLGAVHLAAAVEFLEARGVVHNNISCACVYVSPAHCPWIGGVSAQFKLGEPAVNNRDLSIPFLPLEYMRDSKNAVNKPTSDIWAFATTVWQIFNEGVVPTTKLKDDDLIKMFEEGKRLPQLEGMTEGLRDILRSCWDPIATLRPSGAKLLRSVDSLFLQEIFNKEHSSQNESGNTTNQGEPTQKGKNGEDEDQLEKILVMVTSKSKTAEEELCKRVMTSTIVASNGRPVRLSPRCSENIPKGLKGTNKFQYKSWH